MFPKPTLALTLGKRTIDYSRNYGIDKRSGWSVCIDGSVVVQFVSLWRAAKTFVFWRGWN